ncbi:MAG TPA: nicotinate-nucleotide--dimethylbenzimidazole phosphoribosyltransferase [Burkholderiaceae bacterium]|nr:nicotinate-nucleotide--dimethylbenzimidazole phosphoribosyltransferase [Burkholderiaceae bacterium]
MPIADATLDARLRVVIDRKTKPLGALGRLEALALQLGLIQRAVTVRLHAPQVIVFAADHGLARQGVSAYPQAVTRQMITNMVDGGAAISVLARQHGLALTVVDAGIVEPLHDLAGNAHVNFIPRRIGPGTRDASIEPAMTQDQCQRAIASGREIVRQLPGNALLVGEMGIGNTSAAALLLARLANFPIESCVGRGTGLDADQLKHKAAVLERALTKHATARAPLDVLATFGGFEIAMMVGALWQAAHERRVVVVDGFITTAAVLVAHALAPAVLDYCVFAHRSDENAHALMLSRLGVAPLLDLQLRLGEGSGAVLAWPLVCSAAHVLNEMASFESAGVADRDVA